MARRLREAARSRGLVAGVAAFSLSVSVTAAFVLVPGVDVDRVPVSEPIEELLGLDDSSASAAARPSSAQRKAVSGAKNDAPGAGRHRAAAASQGANDASSVLGALETTVSPTLGVIASGKGHAGVGGNPTFTPPASGSQGPSGGSPPGGVGGAPGPVFGGGTDIDSGNGTGGPPRDDGDSAGGGEGRGDDGQGDDDAADEHEDDVAEAIAEAQAKIQEAKEKAAEAIAEAKQKAEEAKQKAKEAAEKAKKAVEEAHAAADSP